jgi:hypothetical protein
MPPVQSRPVLGNRRCKSSRRGRGRVIAGFLTGTERLESLFLRTSIHRTRSDAVWMLFGIDIVMTASGFLIKNVISSHGTIKVAFQSCSIFCIGA